MKFLESSVASIIVAFLFFVSATFGAIVAQVPEGIPNDSDPDPLNMQDTSDVMLYIVIPVILVVVYFGLRYFRGNKEK